jgi:outer membrane protein TolC
MFRSNELVRTVTPQDYGFGITITLPLLDWGSRRNRIRQAEESAHAQQDRLSDVRNQIRQEVEQSLVHVRTANSLLKSYRQGILERAKRLMEASRTGLQEGQLSIPSVLEAQRTYRNVHIEVVNAQAEYALAVADLERTMGTVPASLLPAAPQEVRRSK